MAKDLVFTASDCSDAVAVFGDGQEEMPVHSQVLRIVSPVFNAMFASDMKEASTRRVQIDLASRPDFAVFYRCLLPGEVCASHISAGNVCSLLELSDYYQIEFLKDSCIEVLRNCPASIPKLIMAKKHAPQELYDRLLSDVMASKQKHDFSTLKAHADILYDMVTCPAQTSEFSAFKPYVDKMVVYVGQRPHTEQYDGMARGSMFAGLRIVTV